MNIITRLLKDTQEVIPKNDQQDVSAPIGHKISSQTYHNQ